MAAGYLFDFLAHDGQREQAMAVLDAAAEVLPTGWPSTWGGWVLLQGVVEGLAALGERDRAGAMYDVVVAGIEGTGTVAQPYFDARLLQRTAGIAAFCARRFDDAERHLRIAVGQAAELAHLPEQAHTSRIFATMLLERDAPGDRAEAHRMAGEAADLYRRMGMPRHLQMVEEMM